MKIGINVWSFPAGKSLAEIFAEAAAAGFDGVEVALEEGGEVGLGSTAEDMRAVAALAKAKGVELHSVASGLYWKYSPTSDAAAVRAKAAGIAKKQLEIASWLGAETILAVPGAVGVDFIDGGEVIPYDTAYGRALEFVGAARPIAERLGVEIGIENVWNKFLLSPLEMRDFIDAAAAGAGGAGALCGAGNAGAGNAGAGGAGAASDGAATPGTAEAAEAAARAAGAGIGSASRFVGAYFDVGNVLSTGYPEHWIKILGKRIKKVHFKDYRRSVGTLAGFVDLLSGDANYPAVMEAFREIGYDGWATAETGMYSDYPDQGLRNTANAMKKIVGRL